MSNEQPIIIKKKVSHAGHHGGAWKVAYADFVTAMMALFIVLWLMSSSSKQTQQEIAGYFKDPAGTAAKHGTNRQGAAENMPLKKEDLSKLKETLLQSIHQVDNLKKLKGQIEVTITDEGLRIELMEDKNGTFFQSGSAQPTPILEELLRLMASQLGTLPNKISVEGHTDAQPYSSAAVYSNWELSSDRANVARRLMQSSGVKADQISQVRGFADQRLRKPQQPFDASNRRVSLIVQYLDKPEPAAGTSGSAAAAAGPKPVASTAQSGKPAAATPAAPR